MSQANSGQISIIKEVTYGTTPSGALKIIPMTGESIGQATDSVTSQTIRADRFTADLIRTGLRVNGDTNHEFQYGGVFHDIYESALFSAPWTTASVNPLTGSTYTVAASGNNFTITRTAGTFDFTTITDATIGRYGRFGGFAASGNNETAKIVSAPSATVLTVTNIVMTPVVGATGLTFDIQSEAKAGTTLASYSMERAFTDVASDFAADRGMLLNALEWSGTANGIMTLKATWLGKNEQSASATIGTSYTAAPTSPIMNGIDNFAACFEGNVSMPLFSFNLKIENNLRERLQMGTLGPISIAAGSIGISGNITPYYGGQTNTGKALIDKYLNWTASALAIKVLDAAGNREIIDTPALKFSSGKRNIPGLNQEVFANMDFTGYLSASESQMFRIVRDPTP